MKSITIISFLLTSCAYGQRGGADEFKKEDSLEGLYVNDTLLRVIDDTLPLHTVDDFHVLRNIRLVSYFYDSLNSLRKIIYINGREGNYYFYFEGTLLKKARVLKPPYFNILKFYFTTEDNSYTLPEIELKITRGTEQKDLYEALKMGKAFFERFNTLCSSQK